MSLISPSILISDFLRLGEQIEMLNESVADFIHLDIMDGVFVPNISFGFPIIEKIKSVSKKPLDVHLMITEPERYIKQFKDCGADNLAVHYEASYHLHRTVQNIKELGMTATVVLNPHTPVSVLEEILPDLYMVLLMTVNPGFGGQKFIPGSYNKIKKLKTMIQSQGLETLIEVDGGVTLENSVELRKAGVDVFVAGNTVFSAPDPKEMIRKIRNGN